MSRKIRRSMQGVVEFLRLYTSKSNPAVSDSKALVSIRPWQRTGFASPGSVRTVAAAASGGGVNAGGMGMGDSGRLPRPPSRPSSRPRGCFPHWAKVVMGSVFSLLLAFWGPKWTTLLKIGGEAEVVINEVEGVAEVVEKVATVVEKVSEEVADTIPNDNKIKEAALVVEHISKEAAKDAHIAQEIIHKIDAAKGDIEDVGKIVEPIIENIVHDGKSKETGHS